MKNHISRRFSVFCLLFSVFCEAALIKSPVPPSAEGHFVRDTDGDGVADQIAIKFLNPIDSAYLKSAVDSIVISDNFVLAGASPKKNMLFLDVIGRAYVTSGISAILYQKGATPVKLDLVDSLAPVPISASVFAGNGMNGDTLVVDFSESVENSQGALSLLAQDGSSKEFSYRAVSSPMANKIKFVLDRKTAENLSASDVISLSAGVARDASLNSSKVAKLPLKGVSAFHVVTNAQANFSAADLKNAPIFESRFSPIGTEFPENHLGMGVDFGSPEFMKALRNVLAEKGIENASLENVLVRMEINVYSHSGEYLTNSHLDVAGSSPKIAGGSRVFFFWNFMDSRRRIVGSGVYLVRTNLQIYYQGNLVVKDNVGTLHAFGVVRK